MKELNLDTQELLKVKMSGKYCIELRKIYEQIDKLKTKQVYEFSGVRSDGSIATMGMSLETQINELMNKIDNSKPRLEDEIEAAVKKAGI